MHVYVIVNRINGKLYVGKANDPIDRWKDHCENARRGHTKALYSAMRKYGDKHFEFRIFQSFTTEKDSLDAEAYWVEHFDAMNPKIGYNRREGGSGGRISEEAQRRGAEKMRLMGENHPARRPDVRAKKSASMMGKNKGKKYGNANNGMKNDPEVRKKVSASHLAYGEDHWMKRPEVRMKVSQALKGQKRTPEQRRQMSLQQKGKHLGTKSHFAKLTEEIVLEIKKMLAVGIHYLDVARKFGINDRMVRRIRNGTTWSHVQISSTV